MIADKPISKIFFLINREYHHILSKQNPLQRVKDKKKNDSIKHFLSLFFFTRMSTIFKEITI